MAVRREIEIGGWTMVAAGLGALTHAGLSQRRWPWIATGAIGITAGVEVVAAAIVARQSISEESAYNLGHDVGYDQGYFEGRRTSRPTVVPLVTERKVEQVRVNVSDSDDDDEIDHGDEGA